MCNAQTLVAYKMAVQVDINDWKKLDNEEIKIVKLSSATGFQVIKAAAFICLRFLIPGRASIPWSHYLQCCVPRRRWEWWRCGHGL